LETAVGVEAGITCHYGFVVNLAVAVKTDQRAVAQIQVLELLAVLGLDTNAVGPQ